MRGLPLIIVLAFLAALAPAAFASESADEAIEAVAVDLEKEGRSPWHRITFGGSAMLIADFGTTVRVDANESDRGTELSLEDLLGLDDDMMTWRLGLAWRPSRNHILSLSYFDIRRSGSRQVDGSLEIGDEELTAGASVDTTLNTRIIKFNWWPNLFSGESWEVGIGLGVYWMNIGLNFEGDLVTPNEQNEFSVEESITVDFPPPLLGLRGAWAITDRLRLSGSAEALYVPIDKYEGWIIDVNLDLQWDVLDFAGLSVGYNFFDMGLKADYSGFHGEIEYDFHALTAGIYIYF